MRKAMKLSAKDLLELNVIDEMIAEPIGGAHRDKDLILKNIRESISKNLDSFKEVSPDEILIQRKNKFLKIGRNKGFITDTSNLSDIYSKKMSPEEFFKSKKNILIMVMILFVSALSLIFFL